MINQQMDIYAVYRDYKIKGQYRKYNDGKLVYDKLGSIYPSGYNDYNYPTAPTLDLRLEPKKSADIIILPKGVKPGEEMQQGMGQPQQQNYQQQNYNQGGPQHISSSMPMSDPADPGNSGQGYR